MASSLFSKRIILIVVIVILSVMLITVIITVIETLRKDNPQGTLPVIKEVPPFELRNQLGDVVTLDTFRESVWVGSFIFTNCGGICPSMTFNMAQLQNLMPENLPVYFVSITVDPERDTEEVLFNYAEKAGADHSRWLFLTGDVAEIYSLSREGFLLGVDPDGGVLEEPILHSQRFVLVDQSGRIRGYYDGFSDEELDALKEDIIFLLK